MTGLVLSQAYYRQACLPILREKLPECLGRMAVGLVGEGSECFGWDDDISRDHSWGPRIFFWLTSEDFFFIGAELMRVVQHFPRQFAGYSVQPVLPNEGIRSGIQKISDFYTSLIGLPRAPTTIKEWLSMEEVKLASACNGQIFSDPPGVFTAIRNGLLAYYPEDVRLRRLAKHTAIAAQTGQYNLKRCLLRGDNMAAYFAKAKFLESVVAIVFLLNRRYRPFYKWAYRGMRELQILSQKVYPIINSLAEENQPRKICESVEEISSLLIQELRHQSLSTSDSDFLMDHCGELLLRIEEPQLRTKPISLAF